MRKVKAVSELPNQMRLLELEIEKQQDKGGAKNYAKANTMKS